MLIKFKNQKEASILEMKAKPSPSPEAITFGGAITKGGAKPGLFFSHLPLKTFTANV
jgi:hypothetical protein